MDSILHAIRQTERLRQTVLGIHNQATSVSDARHFQRALLDPIERTSRMVSDLGAVAQAAREVHENYLYWTRILAKSAEICSQNDWWVVPCMPLSFYARIVRYEGQITSELLTRVIVDYMNRDDAAALASLIPTWAHAPFKARRGIFEDALWAHQQGKYTLSVPTLIVHVEGVLREVLDTHLGLSKERFGALRKDLKQKITQKDALPRDHLPTDQDIQALINYHNLAFLESLYAHYNPTNRMEPVALNRHALAHGLWLTYASEEASTRSFLFLDMVHSLVDELVDSLDGERNDQGTP